MKGSYKLREWVAERTRAQYPPPRYAIHTQPEHPLPMLARIALGSLLIVFILFLGSALALGLYIVGDVLFT